MENEEKKEVVVKEIIKEVPSKRKINFPGPFKIFLYIVILCILFGGSIFGITIGVKEIFNNQEKVLKLGLDETGELVTQICHTVVLEDSRESKTFFDLFEIPFSESRQIFSYDFDVEASINFSNVVLEKVSDKDKEIIIKLPHAKIYKVTLLPNSFKSYLDKDSIFSTIDLTEHNDALIKMQDSAKAQCLTNELLYNADQNAQTLLTAMIKSDNYYKDYSIIFNYFEE